MPKLEVQETITRFENRLLKAEGRLFGFQQLFSIILLAQDAKGQELFRQHIERMRDVLSAEISKGNMDMPTAKIMQAARDLAADLLKNDASAGPALTVIEGGKIDD